MVLENFQKKYLIAGGTGMVYQQLLKILTELGSNIRVVSLDNPKLISQSVLNNIEFIQSVINFR